MILFYTSLRSASVLFNGTVFNRFKWFKIKCLAACSMNLKIVKYFKEIKGLKSLKNQTT